MWGYTDDSNPDLLALHLSLANKLSYMPWKRVHIWNSSASVHEWSFGRSAFAFDVALSNNRATVTLISREKTLSDELGEGLALESVSYKRNPNRTERFGLGVFQVSDEIDQVDQIVELIKKARRAVELTLHETHSYVDEATGLSVNYSVKPDRKSNSNLIFIFTSIRTKQHWTDFDGPLGKSLQSNRARIIFINDDVSAHYSYHMAISGNKSINDATIRFIKDYVAKNGYNWDNVTLAGMSKGGTAALVLGCQLPGCDVVALAPQLRLGDYLVHSKRNAIISNISGKSGPDGAAEVDHIMWSLMSNVQGRVEIGQCYVLTSLKDTHCVEGLDKLKVFFADKCDGRLNVHVDESDFTTNHIETVLHLMPMFVSFLGLAAAGIKPDFK